MARQASAERAKKLFLESRYLIVGENVNQMLPSTSWDCGNIEGMWNCTWNTPTKRLIIASRNWRSISCFLMSSAPYGIGLKWKQKCWLMLSWMCGFGVSAIVKQPPRRTPPPISNSASGNCEAFLNAPKRMGTLSIRVCQESTVLHKSF